jgi:hypothetical protein
MFDSISKISVRQDPYGRFVAIVIGTWCDAPRELEYRTDRARCGLWVWDDAHKDWRQLCGTSSFAARSSASFRRRLRRILTWR